VIERFIVRLLDLGDASLRDSRRGTVPNPGSMSVYRAACTALAKDLRRWRRQADTAQGIHKCSLSDPAKFVLFNAGMGAGAAAGALVSHRAVTESLALLWWVAVATCAVAMAAVWISYAKQHALPQTAPDLDAARATGGYRVVFADRALLRVLLVASLTSAAGYGVYNAGLPVVAVISGNPGIMSWASVANCVTVVAGLPLALRVTNRLRPHQLLATTAAVWSAGWLLCAAEAQTHLLGARVALPLAAGLMGIGELLLAGALPAMVNALARTCSVDVTTRLSRWP
jgi:hypothetical protein